MMSFFNYKKGSKKWNKEREGFFYYEIHMKCAGVIHLTLLSAWTNFWYPVFNFTFKNVYWFRRFNVFRN